MTFLKLIFILLLFKRVSSFQNNFEVILPDGEWSYRCKVNVNLPLMIQNFEKEQYATYMSVIWKSSQ